MKRAILLIGILTARAALADDVPGGKPSSEPRECGAARNHCQRGDAWFVTGYSNEHGNQGMRPAFPRGEGWFLWDGSAVDGGTAYRTKPASASTLQDGRQALVFAPSAGRPKLPATELEALTSRRWSVVVVWEIDAAAGTFVADGTTYPIDAARVLSDPKSVD